MGIILCGFLISSVKLKPSLEGLRLKIWLKVEPTGITFFLLGGESSDWFA